MVMALTGLWRGMVKIRDPVPHHHVLTLAQHGKPGLFKRADSIKVIDAGKLGQS